MNLNWKCPVNIHWDYRLIEEGTGHETVDRLSILVTGQGLDQLLAVSEVN